MKKRIVTYGILLSTLLMVVAGCDGMATLFHGPEPAVSAPVTSVSVSPAAVRVVRGKDAAFSATVSGTGNPAQSVIWSVSGGVSGTSISAGGVLSIDADESAETLTVRATSTVDTAKSGEAEVTVIAVTSVTVSPATAEVAKNGTATFSAEVAGTGNPAQSVTWSVSGGVSGTTITTSGVLVVAAETTDNATLIITATSTVDNTKSGTAIVSVKGVATVSTVSVSPDAVRVVRGKTQDFSATVAGTNNPAQSVTWMVSGGVSGTAISAGGILSIASDESAETLTVRATSAVDTAKSGAATVTVIAVTSVSVNQASVRVVRGNKTPAFSATVAGTNNPAQSVTWSVSGGVSGTTITTGGVLSIAASESAATLTVKATSTVETTKSGTATVAVIAVTGVTLSPATASAVTGGTKTFSATVSGANSPAQSVTWSVSGGKTGTTISDGGVLTVAANESAGILTVRATSTVDTTRSGTVIVTIFVGIQGGTFTMGSPETEVSRYSNEGPQHQVTVISFYMGKYEVTQKEWVEIMGSNPSGFKGDNLPVERVSWYSVIDYCNKRSVKEGLTPAYTVNGTDVTWNKSANGYRLPTEAEWEYACRAGTTTPFNTGNNITTSQANYNGNNPYNGNATGTYQAKTVAVGSFAPNLWGLYDMHGNVYEYCWDWYGAYSTSSQSDPTGASSGERRVARGGSWFSYGMFIRSAWRNLYLPSDSNADVGFRLVRSSF
jgi:formylglycine-generating enzyme required for sulfatase activity